MHLLLFVLLEMYSLSSVNTFPDGSVSPVCDSMIPSHATFVPQNTTAPYTITVNRRTFGPGDVIRVTLESMDSKPFEGFMLQARPTSGNSAVGYFMPGNASLVRLHNCFNTEKSVISHSAANDLTRIEVTWVAPPSPAPGNIAFCATIVRNFAEFWTMVKSQNIVLSNSPALAVNCLVNKSAV